MIERKKTAIAVLSLLLVSLASGNEVMAHEAVYKDLEDMPCIVQMGEQMEEVEEAIEKIGEDLGDDYAVGYMLAKIEQILDVTMRCFVQHDMQHHQ